MSDKRTGKKVKRAAALAPVVGSAAPTVVSDLTQRPPMKKKGK